MTFSNALMQSEMRKLLILQQAESRAKLYLSRDVESRWSDMKTWWSVIVEDVSQS